MLCSDHWVDDALSSVTGSTMDTSGGQDSSDSTFDGVDYVVFVLTLVTAVAIGVYTAMRNGQRDTINEYLLGGKKLNPMAVLLSLLGGWISAISILGKELLCMLSDACYGEKISPRCTSICAAIGFGSE